MADNNNPLDADDQFAQIAAGSTNNPYYVGEGSTTTNFKGYTSLSPAKPWESLNTSVPTPEPEVTPPEIAAVTDRYQNVTVEEGGDGDQQRMLDNAGQGTRAYSQMSPSGMLDMDGRALSGLGSAFDQVSKVTDPIKDAVTNQFDKATSFLPDMPQSLKDTAKSLSILGSMASPQGLLTGMLAGVNYEDKFGYNQNLSGIVASIAGLQSGISPQGYSASFKESMAAASQGKTTEQLRAAIEAGLIKSVGVHSLGGATMYEPTEKGLRQAKAYRDSISMPRAIAEGLYGRKVLGTDQFGKPITEEGMIYGESPNGNGWNAVYDEETGRYSHSVSTNTATGQLDKTTETNLRGSTIKDPEPAYGFWDAITKSREELDTMIAKNEQQNTSRAFSNLFAPTEEEYAIPPVQTNIATSSPSLEGLGYFENLDIGRGYGAPPSLEDPVSAPPVAGSPLQVAEAKAAWEADRQASQDREEEGGFDFGPAEGTEESAAEDGGLEEGQFEGEAQGGTIKGRYEKGGKIGTGMIRGPGSATSDSIPMKADPGDFILNAAAVKYFGQDRIQKDIARAIRKIAKPGFAVGGAPDNIGSTPIRVSNGEMFIPKELKGAFGEDKLNRMNDYGKQLMAQGSRVTGYQYGSKVLPDGPPQPEFNLDLPKEKLESYDPFLIDEMMKPYRGMFEGLTDEESLGAIMDSGLIKQEDIHQLNEFYRRPSVTERYTPEEIQKRFLGTLKKGYVMEKFFPIDPETGHSITGVPYEELASGGALRGTPRTHGYHNAVLPGTGYADGAAVEEGYNEYSIMDVLSRVIRNIFGVEDDTPQGPSLTGKALLQVIESLDPARNPLPPDPEDDGTLLPRERNQLEMDQFPVPPEMEGREQDEAAAPQGFTIQRGPELDPRERNIREMQDFRAPGDDPEFQEGNGFISGGELQGVQGNRFGALYKGAARAQTPGGQPSLSERDPLPDPRESNLRETQGFVSVPEGVTDNVELSNMKDFIYKKEGAFNKKYNVGGDKYKSYWDPLANKGKGVWTMPGGLTTERGFSVTKTTIKTKTEIKAEMNRRVSRNDAWFSKKYGKKYDDLNINQKTALNSLVHNVGRAAFGGDSSAGVKESKASKAFKRGDMETFKLEAFGKNSWSYKKLKSRRDSEMAKWNTPVN